MCPPLFWVLENNTEEVPGLPHVWPSVIAVELLKSGMNRAFKNLTAFALTWAVDFLKSKVRLLLCILILLGFSH